MATGPIKFCENVREKLIGPVVATRTLKRAQNLAATSGGGAVFSHHKALACPVTSMSALVLFRSNELFRLLLKARNQILVIRRKQ